MNSNPAGTPSPVLKPMPWWAPLRRAAGRVVRGTGRLIDQALHPLRRRTARRRLARLGPQREVLVLCFGNICRSPYAAAVLSRMLLGEGRRVEVTQGGFYGPDRRSPDAAQEAAAGRGVNLGSHRSRLLTPDGARAATLVVVMETAQAERVSRELGVSWSRTLVLGDLDPEAIPSRDIADPYGLNRDVFDFTYARIDRCVAALVSALPPG